MASFEIGNCEVTWGEWNEVRDWAVKNNGYDLLGLGGTWPMFSGDNFPVIAVSWYDVVKWCNAKSEKENKSPVYQASGGIYRSGEFGDKGSAAVSMSASANGYRLPSEKEWEWAARGGVSSQGYTYSGSNTASEVAWTYENSVYGSAGAKAVGTKLANELGIYDMAGNVSEWCWDDYDDPNPSYLHRRFRGGNWFLIEQVATVAYRFGSSEPSYRGIWFGFRLARKSGN